MTLAPNTTITHRTPLPATIPPGGAGVILVDGRVADKDWLQDPGEITPERWQSGPLQKKKRIEAVVFPRRDIRLTLEVEDLHSAEGVRLDMTVTLALRIEEPARFLVDVVKDRRDLSETDLAALLAGPIRTSLHPLFQRHTLEALNAMPDLRSKLNTAITYGLSEDADLLHRSGLAVRSVDAYDLRCQVWDQVQARRETLYLQAALAQADARGRKVLDEQVLAALREHLPIKEELVAHKERMAELTAREVEAEGRIQQVHRQKIVQVRAWVASLRRPDSSLMRPELWRRRLGEPVRTAPLLHGERVYVNTKGGALHAFDSESGEPVWPQPLKLPTSPGDGMIMAAGLLWIPGRDGRLYGVAPQNGAIQRHIDIGGRLSSAPILWEDRLLFSVDVNHRTLREGGGQLAVVDTASGRVQRWQVSRWGLRAAPARWGHLAFVGDRRGNFFQIDLRRDQVERLFSDGGRILGQALIDEPHRQVVIGDQYGRIRALDFSGRERWRTTLGGPVVGRPLLHRDHLFAGAGDGCLYQLDVKSGARINEPYRTNGPIVTSPVAWEDWVFVGSNDQKLHAFDIVERTTFWTYHSGAPISLTPAVSKDGVLFVVDNEGHLNALRWCLSQYPKAARRMAQAQRWWEATTLWIQAGMVDAALEAAERSGRLDVVAELAEQQGWYDKAAKTYETLAGRRSDKPLKAAVWWAAAAEQWRMVGDAERALHCRLQDANARQAPYLTLTQGNLPQLEEGKPDVVQVLVRNHTGYLARDLTLSYRGHVKKAGTKRLGALGPHDQRLVDIPIVPTASGSAEIEVTLQYADSAGDPQLPATLFIALSVSRPPEVHQHFYGPTATINGDGVIIMHESGSGQGRTLRIQSDGDEIELGRGPSSTPRRCPNCGRELQPSARFCQYCGWRA